MYPEVEQYLAAVEAAEEAYRNSPVNGDCGKGTCRICNRMTSKGSAWASLGESENPLVRWIAENCGAHVSEATEVLRALPAPMSELDALARERRWCDEWDRFKRMAEEAGVLSDTVLLSDTEVSA